jgi:cell wall-associated NlpC family hydrolase
MRPIRLLILLLAISIALVLALLRAHAGTAQGRPPSPRSHHHHATRTHRARHQPRTQHGRSHAEAVRRHLFGTRVVTYARHFLGVAYSWGGTSPRTGFDCSGFVRFVYGHFGIPLPHSSFADLVRGHRVPRRLLRPGDLVFFAGASHVGIYVGQGRFIDAPHSGAVVRISSMHSWYGSSYYAARRFRGA